MNRNQCRVACPAIRDGPYRVAQKATELNKKRQAGRDWGRFIERKLVSQCQQIEWHGNCLICNAGFLLENIDLISPTEIVL
jgi:hypothetical protein